ncbi:MAG TPA: DUF397 domain-containing protein [Candidatus Saccharimonadales bacterium]|jgi:hypothetical protein
MAKNHDKRPDSAGGRMDAEARAANWRKASRSIGNGACVEVSNVLRAARGWLTTAKTIAKAAIYGSGPEAAVVRDPTEPHSVILRTPEVVRERWSAVKTIAKVAISGSGSEGVVVRDSVQPSGTMQIYTKEAWKDFIGRIDGIDYSVLMEEGTGVPPADADVLPVDREATRLTA